MNHRQWNQKEQQRKAANHALLVVFVVGLFVLACVACLTELVK